MKKRTGCFLTGGLLLLLCCGAAAWLYLASQSQGTRAFVQIRAPQSGEWTEVNATLPLMVYAEASRPVLRLEVYADGALVAAANGDNNALTLVQPWTPTTPGRHVLVARAFFAADDFADSQVVFVDTADLSAVPMETNVDAIQRGEGVTEIRVGDLAAAAGHHPGGNCPPEPRPARRARSGHPAWHAPQHSRAAPTRRLPLPHPLPHPLRHPLRHPLPHPLRLFPRPRLALRDATLPLRLPPASMARRIRAVRLPCAGLTRPMKPPIVSTRPPPAKTA